MKYAGWALLFAFIFALLGFAASQLYPFMSGPAAMNICEPFSPCRLDALPGYAALFALIGAPYGLMIAMARDKKKVPQNRFTM